MSLLQDKYPFFLFEKKDDVKSLREVLPKKFSRNGRLVSTNGSLFDISLREEHLILVGGILDLDISLISKGITRCELDGIKCIVYPISREADLFGKVNIFCDEKDVPKYIHLITDNNTIVSERFEGKTFLDKEPILSATLFYEKIKLVLEYDEFPSENPTIICDMYVTSGVTRKYLQGRECYSEEYKFYYTKGYIRGSIE